MTDVPLAIMRSVDDSFMPIPTVHRIPNSRPEFLGVAPVDASATAAADLSTT
ncbi:hypothetical protein HX837_05870 [Marine Group I thaumarchaeote]|uniref:Uncharacterized protein n=1 Tax=Marine Group I thaumarchaeote TaxID=2511932 RepID=A0A7K4MQ48_9ARCH|nr:hypothetical protein [Marine Group I thaumarchaeote]